MDWQLQVVQPGVFEVLGSSDYTSLDVVDEVDDWDVDSYLYVVEVLVDLDVSNHVVVTKEDIDAVGQGFVVFDGLRLGRDIDLMLR
jgi:hypothetical protein